MTIVVSPRALNDIKEAHDYIAADSPAAAERLLQRLDEVFRLLAAGELTGPLVRLRARVLLAAPVQYSVRPAMLTTEFRAEYSQHVRL